MTITTNKIGFNWIRVNKPRCYNFGDFYADQELMLGKLRLLPLAYVDWNTLTVFTCPWH